MDISIEQRKFFLVKEIQFLRHHLDNPGEKIAHYFVPAITMESFAKMLSVYEKELAQLNNSECLSTRGSCSI